MINLGENVVSVGGCTSVAKFASYEIAAREEIEPVLDENNKMVSAKKQNVATVRNAFIYNEDINVGDRIDFIVNFEDNSKKSYLGEVLQVRDKTIKIIIKGTQDINLIIKKIGGLKNGSTNQ